MTLEQPCPDAEALGALTEQRLSDVERAALERHLSGCHDCLDVVTAAGGLTAAPTTRATPPQVLAATPRLSASRAGGATGRTSGRRRLRRVLAMAAGIALLASAGGYLGATRGTDSLSRLAAERASGILGRPVTIGGLALRPGLDAVTLRLGDLDIGTETERVHATAEGLEIALAPGAVLRGVEAVERARLIRPTVVVSGFLDTPSPFVQAHASLADPGGLLQSLAPGRPLDVEDGTLTLLGDGGATLTLDHVDARLVRRDGTVDVTMTARLGGALVTASGTLALDADTEHALEVAAHAVPLDAVRPLVEHARGELDLTMAVSGPPTQAAFRGRLALRAGALTPNPLASLGDSGQTRELPPPLRAAALPVEDARVAFHGEVGGTWSVERAHVTTLGMQASWRADVTPAGTLTGTGTLQVSAEMAQALVRGDDLPAARRVDLPFAITGSLGEPRVRVR